MCIRDRNGRYIYIDTSDAEAAEDLIKTICALLSYIWKQNKPIDPTENCLLYTSCKTNCVSKAIKY